MQQPVVVYVSGAPGSGKTTLASLLSEQLYIPVVSSDLIHGGVALMQPDHDRLQTLHDVFVPTIVDMTSRGISVIVDHVLQKGVSEKDIIEPLSRHARLIYIHAQTNDPLARYEARVRSSTLPSIVQRRPHLLSLVEPHRANLPNTQQPLNLDIPTLVVHTDGDYEPSLSHIVSFIRDTLSE